MTSLPPSGWYPDPAHPGATRWWDGNKWAESSTATTIIGDQREFPEVGDWINAAFGRMRRYWKDTALIGLITAVASALLGGFGLSLVRDDVRWVDGDFQGTGPLAVASVLLIVSSLVGVVGSLAIGRLMLWSVDGDQRAESGPIAALVVGLGVFWRYLGWIVLYTVAAVAAAIVVMLVIVVAMPLGVILGLALMPLVIYLIVKLAWFELAIVDRRGNPWKRSSAVSAGRFWAAVGRLLLQWVIALGFSIGLGLILEMAGGGVPGFADASGVNVVEEGGEVVLVEFTDAFDVSASSYIVGAIAAVISTVLIAGFTVAAMAELYRTANPESSANSH